MNKIIINIFNKSLILKLIDRCKRLLNIYNYLNINTIIIKKEYIQFKKFTNIY